VGTPVDPVPASVRQALTDAADAPGYPLTAGTPRLRAAIVGYLSRRCGVTLGEDSVLPTIGSKELVASLPFQLGVRPGDVVVIPTICYPTYEVGARLAGATVVRADTPDAVPASAGPVRLVWVNSPANPHGRVLSADALRDWVDWARAQGAVLTSDECYLELGFDATPVSVLTACAGAFEGVLAVHSLSKRSNLAGYRAAFVAGDPALVGELLAVRKHAGLIVPEPVQAAMVAALDDSAHAEAQRRIYAARRAALRPALESAGFTIDHSQAGLYLWATRGEQCWSTVDWFAERGILVAPGVFYGPTADRHVRIALTATDERIAAAVARLA
jgi:succinyldiaminopimelate transaminase